MEQGKMLSYTYLGGYTRKVFRCGYHVFLFWYRVSALLNLVSFGVFLESGNWQKNSKVIERLDQIEESYPRHIRYSNISEWWEQQSRSLEIYLTTGIHLDILQCRFLLERLKVSRGFVSEQKLLEVAQQMMAAVLSFWLNRDRLANHLASFEWFVSVT